jgi:molybdopterin converting factor small subunit
VGEAAAALASAYPDIARHLYQDGGELRSYINIFVGETNIKNLKGLDTPVSPGDTIMLVPAIAGGKKSTRTGERVLVDPGSASYPPINATAQEKVTGGGARKAAVPESRSI